MKNNDVYVVDTKIYKYSNDNVFNPSTVYPEGLNIDIKSDSNIYDCVRRLFIQMGLDKGNIGKKNWNPFGDFIKKNNKVVIKPNLVKHINESLDGNTDSLITNFSVIRPIIDYTIIALNGTGSIIVGDAPVQECNFAEVIKLYNLEEAIKKYNDFNYKVELKDFRKNSNPEIECTVVDIGENSSLVETDEYYNIKLSGGFYCLYSNKIDINVISNYEVLNNNAKKVNGNKYTWTIDNSNNVDIMLTVSKTVKYEEPTKAKTFSTFQIIGFVVFAILTIVTYFLYRKKNSGKV